MCSFLSAIPWDRAFHSIYNIRKYLRIYFYFLREFAIFMEFFSNSFNFCLTRNNCLRNYSFFERFSPKRK